MSKNTNRSKAISGIFGGGSSGRWGLFATISTATQIAQTELRGSGPGTESAARIAALAWVQSAERNEGMRPICLARYETNSAAVEAMAHFRERTIARTGKLLFESTAVYQVSRMRGSHPNGYDRHNSSLLVS